MPSIPLPPTGDPGDLARKLDRPGPRIPVITPPKPATPAVGMGQSIKDRKPSDKWISAPGVRYDLGGYQVYFLQISLGTTGYSSFALLAHPELFDKDRLDAMCKEAAGVVLETRTIARRKAISVGQIPIENPHQMNEQCFAADKELFEAVMVDRFGFEQVQPVATRVELEPTIRGLDHHGK